MVLACLVLSLATFCNLNRSDLAIAELATCVTVAIMSLLIWQPVAICAAVVVRRFKHVGHHVVLQVFCVLVGSDYGRKRLGGVQNCGPSTAAAWVHLAFGPTSDFDPATAATCTYVSLWERLKQCAPNVETVEPVGRLKPILRDDDGVEFEYGMFWFNSQVVALTDGDPVRLHVERAAKGFAKEYPITQESLDRFTKKNMTLEPIRMVRLPSKPAPVWVGEAIELVVGGTLPELEADWTDPLVVTYLNTWNGQNKISGLNKEQKFERARQLQMFAVENPDAVRYMRKDPSPNSIMALAHDDGRATAQWKEVLASRSFVEAPVIGYFTISGVADVAGAMLDMPAELVRDYKFKRKDYDGKRMTSDRNVRTAFQQFSEFKFDQVPCIKMAKGKKYDYFAMEMPRTQTMNDTYGVVVQAERDHRGSTGNRYTGVKAKCPCPNGDRGCTHNITALDTIQTLKARKQLILQCVP
jgi:hypothetical protein